tara:strand:+ start:552 stop:1010 length:459 start_codon:yes stop_codon:yes gene_type:complete
MKKLDIKAVDLSSFMKVLRNIDFFKGMTIGQIEKVLPFVMLFSYDKGEVVCTQGEVGDSFFMIREGCVDVSIKSGFFRRKKVIATLGPRECFGEMSLVKVQSRNATVTCVNTCLIFVLVKRDFDYMLSKNPDFDAEIKRMVNDRDLILKNKI